MNPFEILLSMALWPKKVQGVGVRLNRKERTEQIGAICGGQGLAGTILEVSPVHLRSSLIITVSTHILLDPEVKSMYFGSSPFLYAGPCNIRVSKTVIPVVEGLFASSLCHPSKSTQTKIASPKDRLAGEPAIASIYNCLKMQ